MAPRGGALTGYPGSDLRAALQPHFGQQRSDMVLHGLFRHPELFPDFPVRKSIPD